MELLDKLLGIICPRRKNVSIVGDRSQLVRFPFFSFSQHRMQYQEAPSSKFISALENIEVTLFVSLDIVQPMQAQWNQTPQELQ